MEKLIIQQTCPGKPVVLIGCNGDNVSPIKIGERVDIQARVLRRYDPKIIICDREGRNITATQLALALEENLQDRKTPGSFIIGVADREFENWILAGLDPAYQCSFFDMSVTSPEDGTYGKNRLVKGMLSTHYQETVHGPALFKKGSASRMAVASASAQEFIKKISHICNWSNAQYSTDFIRNRDVKC